MSEDLLPSQENPNAVPPPPLLPPVPPVAAVAPPQEARECVPPPHPGAPAWLFAPNHRDRRERPTLRQLFTTVTRTPTNHPDSRYESSMETFLGALLSQLERLQDAVTSHNQQINDRVRGISQRLQDHRQSQRSSSTYNLNTHNQIDQRIQAMETHIEKTNDRLDDLIMQILSTEEAVPRRSPRINNHYTTEERLTNLERRLGHMDEGVRHLSQEIHNRQVSAGAVKMEEDA